MTDHDSPDLQQGQDPGEPETRPDEVEGEDVTPMSRTDQEQDDAGSSDPGVQRD